MLTVLEKVDVLQKAPIFRDVRTESLARIAAIAQPLEMETRHLVFRENTAADMMFVLLEGEVVLLNDGKEDRRAGPPEVLGILPLLAGEHHHQSAMTTRPSRALQIDQQEFFDAMEEDFNIARGILCALVGLLKGESG